MPDATTDYINSLLGAKPPVPLAPQANPMAAVPPAPAVPSPIPTDTSGMSVTPAQPVNPLAAQAPVAPKPLTTKQRVLGALFTGMGAFKSPQLGQSIEHEIFEQPEENYEKQRAQYENEEERQQEDIERQKGEESEAALRTAQGNEANARAKVLDNPIPKEQKTLTPEEQSFNNLLETINPETKKNYTPFEAYQEMKKATEKPSAEPKDDPIDDLIGGKPQKTPTGQWMFGGRTFPDEASAKKAYGNAYEIQKRAEQPQSYAGVITGLHGTDRVDDATTKYTDFAAQSRNLEQVIQEGMDGNQIANSLASMGGALMVTSAAGVHRVNTTEIGAFAGKNGLSWANEINAFLDKGVKGKVPDNIVRDWQNIVQSYRDNTYKAYVTHAKVVAKNNGLSPDQVDISTEDGSGTVPLGQAGNPRNETKPQASKGRDGIDFQPH